MAQWFKITASGHGIHDNMIDDKNSEKTQKDLHCSWNLHQCRSDTWLLYEL